MTKRFTIDEHSNLNKLDDNLKEEFYIIANGFDASQLCDLLNGLNEENKQLKRDFLFKDELIQQLEKTNLHLNHELRLKNDKVLELEKENEQLKQDRKRLIGYLWKYKSMDMEEIEEYILSRELLDEYGEVIMVKGDVE